VILEVDVLADVAVQCAQLGKQRSVTVAAPVVSRNSIGRNVSDARCLPMGKERLYRRDLDA